MYFGIQFMLFMIGIIIASFCGLIPSTEVQAIIPPYFRFLAFLMGAMLGFMGIVFVWIRAKKVGADILINPGRPGTVLWFFFYRDGEMRILPGKRAGEGQLYTPYLDSQVIDVKTYSLCDHKFRIVPEVVGHAVDLDYVMYVDVVETKYGFENLRQLRASKNPIDKIFKKTKEIVDEEHLITEDENESLEEKVRKAKREPTPVKY